ncbi:MAG: glycosyltransferase family 25 protein [Pseudomonadota bacterium]
MTQVPVMLINLNRSEKRLVESARALDALGIDFERVEAVDGETISENELAAYKAPDFSAYYKQLSRAEFGCYFSHRKCWQLICERNLDQAIILEDDFSLKPAFSEFCKRLPLLPIRWECLKLSEFPEKRKAITGIDFLSWKVVAYDKTPCRTGAYAITRSGAQKMLAHSTKITRPVDIDFQYPWEHRVRTLGLKPYPVVTNGQNDSTIDEVSSRKRAKSSYVKKLIHMVQFKINNYRYNKNLLESIQSSGKSFPERKVS